MMSAEKRVLILSAAKPNSSLALSVMNPRLSGAGQLQALEEAKKHGEADPVLIKIPGNWDLWFYLFARELYAAVL